MAGEPHTLGSIRESGLDDTLWAHAPAGPHRPRPPWRLPSAAAAAAQAPPFPNNPPGAASTRPRGPQAPTGGHTSTVPVPSRAALGRRPLPGAPGHPQLSRRRPFPDGGGARAVRTAGGGRVGKREEGRRGGRGAPGNGPRPRRPLKGPLRAPGPDSKANGSCPPASPAPGGAGLPRAGGRGGGGRAPAGGVGRGEAGRVGEGLTQRRPRGSPPRRQVALGPLDSRWQALNPSPPQSGLH